MTTHEPLDASTSEVEAVLEPFKAAADRYALGDFPDSEPVGEHSRLTVGHLRNLRTLLATMQSPTPSDVAELVERLRDGEPVGDDFTDAADLIECLSSEIERKDEALREVRPYVEGAGLRHHNIEPLLAKIDAATLSTIRRS